MKSWIIPFACLFAAALSFILAERVRAQVSVFSSGAIPPPGASATLAYTTWPNGPTGHVNLASSPVQFTMTTDCAITGFDNSPAAGLGAEVVTWWTNSATTNCTIRVTAASYTDVGTGARLYVVTNGSQRVIAFNKNDMGFHGQSQPSY